MTAVRFLALKKTFEAICPQHHTVSGLKSPLKQEEQWRKQEEILRIEQSAEKDQISRGGK